MQCDFTAKYELLDKQAQAEHAVAHAHSHAKKKKKGGGVYIRSALFKLQYIYNVDANPFSSVNNL